MSLHIKRLFTDIDIDPYDKVNWVKRTAHIENKEDPSKTFHQDNVEYPDFWSQTAVNIVSQKYFNGKVGTSEREYSLKQLIDRVVDVIILDAATNLYMEDIETLTTFQMELKHMLVNQYFSYNSPVWFNVGVKSNKRQISACFINSLEDTMESIATNNVAEMEIFRGGSGAGKNSSKLRSSREHINGGGYASGPCSFMRINDSTAAVTKSGGKTRRAAKMEILNMDHGDIVRFIEQKGIEEKKAVALIAAGWSDNFADPDGAYGSVFFQNSNQSVRAKDAFMKAVENDEKWTLIERYPTKLAPNEVVHHKDSAQGAIYNSTIAKGYFLKKSNRYYKVIESISAIELFNKIVEEAWKSGDPGIQFHDTINRWHTCPENGEIVASNPCSEYMFLDDTSCNLASVNLMKFIKEDGTFDIPAYIHTIRLLITSMDILICNANYPTEEIGIRTKKYRTLGLGYANLGAFLMANGFPYDSKEGRRLAADVTYLMHAAAYHQSMELGNHLEPFGDFDLNREHIKEIVHMHIKAGEELAPDEEWNNIEKEAGDLLNSVYRSNGNFKIRNAQVTVLAPTGTISFMMDCDTTGIEPVIALKSYKKLADGGVLQMAAPCASTYLLSKGYTEKDVEEIVEDISSVKISKTDKKVLETAVGINYVAYDAHLKMMAAVQPFLSGAISKTVNMPNHATVRDVRKVYMDAWKMGLKSVAIYRDGCKKSQPVNIEKKNIAKTEMKKEIVKDSHLKPTKKRLPSTRESLTHKFSIGGYKGYFTVGLYQNGEPGELFIRISKGGSTLSGVMDGWATTFSQALQHGVPLGLLIEKMKHTKYEPSGMTDNKQIRFASSLGDYIARWLHIEFMDDDIHDIEESTIKKTIDSISLDGPPCNFCGELTVKNGTCFQCTNCGETTGCS